jgi:hypothetical protein
MRRKPMKKGAKPRIVKTIIKSPLGGQTTSSFVKAGRKHAPLAPYSMLKSIFPVQKYEWVQSNLLSTSTTGTGAPTGACIQGILVQPLTRPQDFSNLMAVINQPVNQIAPVGNLYGPNNTQNVRLAFDGISVVNNFNNTSNLPVEIDIYDIICKRDATDAVRAGGTANKYYTANAVAYNYNGDPGSCWDIGLAIAQNILPTDSLFGQWPTTKEFFGSEPQDSVLFKKHFKILGKQTIMLPLSGIHKHTANYNWNQFIDSTVFSNLAMQAIEGLSAFQMYVIRGSPGVQSELTGNVTSSVATVAFTTNVEYRAHYAPPVGSSLSVNNFDVLANTLPSLLVVEPVTNTPVAGALY